MEFGGEALRNVRDSPNPVCLLDGGLLASSDTAGRCLLWLPGQSSFDRPRPLETNIRSRRFEGLEQSYHKLETRGFEAVALGLRAYEATAKNDPLSELNARHCLMRLLPADDPRSVPSILRYTQILEQIGLYTEARGSISDCCGH